MYRYITYNIWQRIVLVYTKLCYIEQYWFFLSSIRTYKVNICIWKKREKFQYYYMCCQYLQQHYVNILLIAHGDSYMTGSRYTIFNEEVNKTKVCRWCAGVRNWDSTFIRITPVHIKFIVQFFKVKF